MYLISTIRVQENQHLSPLSAFQTGKHFSSHLIQQGDWMYKIDLKNAHWTVPVHRDDQKYLAFQWKGKTFHYKVWPFGLGPVLLMFTKLMKPVMATLRKLGLKNVIYFDDLWGVHSDRETAAIYAQVTVLLLEKLGMMINAEKSVLSPTQILEYTGYNLDSVKMELSQGIKYTK